MEPGKYQEILQGMFSAFEGRLRTIVDEIIDQRFIPLLKSQGSHVQPTAATTAEIPSSIPEHQPAPAVNPFLQIHIKTMTESLPMIEISENATVADLKRLILHAGSVNKRRRLFLPAYDTSNVVASIELIEESTTLMCYGVLNASVLCMIIEDFPSLNLTDQRCIVKYNQPYSNMRHALENLLNQRTGRLELIINSNSDSNLVQVLQRNRTVSTLALHFSEAKSASDCVEIHCLNKFLEHLVSNTTISTLELKSTPQNRQFHSGKLNFIDCLPLNSCNLIGQILRSNSNIKYLEMRCNLADINGMFTIISGLSSKSSNITKMNLQGSFTELVILTSLCGFLESNTVITDINLSDCGIDSDEAASTIARVVQSNTSLVSLNISGCRFSAAGSKQIANALSTNTSLSWLDVSFNVEGRVSVVEVLSHGTYYRVPPAETGAVHFADSLIHNTSLQSLHLRGHFVSTETRGFIQALTQNITLTELSFPFFNQLHDHDELPSVIIEFIASTSSLKKIRFLERFSVNMSCALATVLQDRHFISDLDLSGCFFPLSSWNERNESSILVREMPTIGMVALFDSLHACPSLTRLRAQSIQEGNLFCRPNSHVIGKLIRQSKSITELDLSHSNCYLNFHLVADALKQNTSLISLNLANSAIGDSGAIALSAVMRENFVLKCLNVTNNSIGRHGIHSISQSLRQNSSLSHLLISSYDMPITDIDVLFSRKYLSQSNCHIDVGIEERL